MISFSLYSPLPLESTEEYIDPQQLHISLPIDVPEFRDDISYDLDFSLKSPAIEQFPYTDTIELPDFTSQTNNQKPQNIEQPKLLPQLNLKKTNHSQTILSLLLSNMQRLQSKAQLHPKTKENAQKTTQIEEANDDFTKALNDQNLKINPLKLGFIPQNRWTDSYITFGEVVREFFQRKNNSSCRFSHKLYNALKLSELDSKYERLIGVKWINNEVLKVDKHVFARFLGIKSIDGSLFHQQGNFPSHGFVEMNTTQVQKLKPNSDLDDVDFENIRLLTHTDKVFVKGCMEKDLENCKWINSRPKR